MRSSHSEPRQPIHPLDSKYLNLFSRLTFSWLFNLISLGRQRELENEDVYRCPRFMSSTETVDEFDNYISSERQKKKPSFSMALWNLIRQDYKHAFLYVVPFILCYLFQPLFIRGLLKKLEDKEDDFFKGWGGCQSKLGC